MKFGLSVLVQHPSHESGAERIGELIEQVKLARGLGFNSISASQHYLAAPFQSFQSLPLLARIAAESGEMTLITHMRFRVLWLGMPHDLVVRTIRLLGKKVLPACR